MQVVQSDLWQMDLSTVCMDLIICKVNAAMKYVLHIFFQLYTMLYFNFDGEEIGNMTYIHVETIQGNCSIVEFHSIKVLQYERFVSSL